MPAVLNFCAIWCVVGSVCFWIRMFCYDYWFRLMVFFYDSRMVVLNILFLLLFKMF